jgi:hypothetical protein
LRLLEEGHRVIRAEGEAERARRQEAVRRTRGALTGVYPRGYLSELRGDWPT